MARTGLLLIAALTILKAETIENNGKPMHIPPVCKPADLQSLGLTCAEDEPCPMYLELTAIASAGNRLFVTGNIHTPATTLSSILLGSADAGHSWVELSERIRFSALEQIQFIDMEYGWISGAVVGALPRDPFFLLTRDGGKTWTMRPMFEETHGGSVDHFWFDTRKTGRVLLTPNGGTYEIYRTESGGDEWQLEESSSRPLKVASHSTSDSGWRIRANGRTRAFDIESKEGAGWKHIASFLVESGVCK